MGAEREYKNTYSNKKNLYTKYREFYSDRHIDALVFVTHYRFSIALLRFLSRDNFSRIDNEQCSRIRVGAPHLNLV